MKFLKTALFAVILLACSTHSGAQTGGALGAYTPYSLFGLGDISRPGTTYNLSMAGVGIADRNARFINILNPAAVNVRESRSFMMDFGLENRNNYYQGNAATAIGSSAEGPLKSANNTVNMHHIVASLPIYDNAAFKLGIMPYSNVGYDFTAHETDDGVLADMGDIIYGKSGEGTIYQSFLGAGYTMFDRLSIGADVNYYFGAIDRYSTAAFTTSRGYRSVSTGWNYVVSAFSGKFGLQYEQPLNAGSKLTLGATYTMGTEVKGSETRYAYVSSSSAVDTITHDNHGMRGYDIPREIGVGINYRSGEKFMMEFDYTLQDWSKVSFEETPGVDFKASKAQSFRLGFEITPDRYDVRYALKRLTYRGGIYRENSYMSLNGRQITAEGITLGFTIPINRYYNGITFSAELGRRGTLQSDLIKERFLIFTVSFNMHDIWFLKSLYN